MACLDNETATAYLRGDLEPAEADRWAAHLAECDSCRRLVQEVSALIDTVRRDLMLAYSDPVTLDWRLADRVVNRSRPAARRILHLPSLRPRLVGASLATAVAVVLFVIWWREAPVTAAEALRRATVAEQATANNASEILHRTLAVEERRQQNVVRRQRVEIWQNAANRTKVRRLYDERGRLLAGEWTRGDGSRALYQPSKPPVIESADAEVPLDSENAWRWEPSVASFVDGESSQAVSLERRDERAYVLRRVDGSRTEGIHASELTVAADDFRPIAQTFLLTSSEVTREFTLTEQAFETLPPGRVEPARFVPEQELLPTETPAFAVLPAPKAVPARPTSVAPPNPPSRLDHVAMRAWYRLHGLGLRLGNDASVYRTADGRIGIDVTVSSEVRRIAVGHRLKSLRGDHVVEIDIRVASTKPPAAAAPTDWSSNPTYIKLRERVAATLPAAADASANTDIIARETARWMLDQSNQIQERIEALARFSAEWPPDRLRNLDLDALAEWQTIVRDHVVDAGQLSESLFERCRQLFSDRTDKVNVGDIAPLSGLADVNRLTTRLLQLGSRQLALVSQALSVASADLDVGQLDMVLAEITTIATRFAGPWPLGQ